jgi:hypothetical protein
MYPEVPTTAPVNVCVAAGFAPPGPFAAPSRTVPKSATLAWPRSSSSTFGDLRSLQEAGRLRG